LLLPGLHDLSVGRQEQLGEVHHIGLVVDPQLMLKQQTNSEQRELSLVGDNLDSSPRAKPIHKAVVCVEVDLRTICQDCLHHRPKGQAQCGDLLLRDDKFSSKSGVDPDVHLDHACRLRKLQTHPTSEAIE
jgi:hypothetical protein